MTDEQIIKAVGICRTPGTCRCCPYHELYTTWCVCALMKDVFDLINRQKAEIEVLEKGLTEYKLRLKMSECTADEIKSEAIKELAERLKSRLANLSVRTKTHGRKTTPNYVDDIANQILHDVVLQEIDNLVKEMTEAQE